MLLKKVFAKKKTIIKKIRINFLLKKKPKMAKKTKSKSRLDKYYKMAKD